MPVKRMSAPITADSPTAGSRWTPQRVAYGALALVVLAFLLVKAAEDLRQFVVVTLSGHPRSLQWVL